MIYMLYIHEPEIKGGILKIPVVCKDKDAAYESYYNDGLEVLGPILDAVPVKPTLIERIVNLFKR